MSGTTIKMGQTQRFCKTLEPDLNCIPFMPPEKANIRMLVGISQECVNLDFSPVLAPSRFVS